MSAKQTLRIVFMGTPEFAVASLSALSASRHKIVGVVTAPDKPAGRGGKMRISAVKSFGLEQGYKIWQPVNLKDPSFIDHLKLVQPDLIVVVAFRMLPAVVWQIPSLGTINLHASLLPNYRGAAPINWAIANGEKQTGVTTFFINENIDTGDIIDQRIVEINPEMDAGDLHDVLMSVGAEVLAETVDKIACGEFQRKTQSGFNERTVFNDAPKLTKENTSIDWSLTAHEVVNFIRGMSPYPGAHTILNDGTPIKIFKAVEDEIQLAPGTISTDGKRELIVGTKRNCVSVLELQLPGKRRMAVRDFLNGFSNHEELKSFGSK